MKWLGDASDDIEHSLREGLDRAAKRTGDELLHRRVWARVSDLPLLEAAPVADRRRLRLVAALTAGLALAGGAGAFLLMRAGQGAGETVASPTVVAGSIPASTIASVASEQVPVAGPVLLGPATVRTGIRERRTVVVKGQTRIELQPETVLAVDAGQRPAVQRGRVTFQVPRQPPGERFTVAAGPFVIVVVGTQFDVGVNRNAVEVKVSEGLVEVWRDGEVERMVPGDARSWSLHAPLEEPAFERAEPRPRMQRPPRAPGETEAGSGAGSAGARSESDLFRDAGAALTRGEPERALELLGKLAQGTGPGAENASYEIGRVLRDHQRAPREAVKAWMRYRARFPHGLLRAEADISILDTLVVAGDQATALTEAEAFLGRYPHSERRAEVARIAERLRAAAAVGSLPGGALAPGP